MSESLRENEGAYRSCILGAISREECRAKLAAAGLQEAMVVSAQDAAALLAQDCCGGGVTGPGLPGVVTSLHITARKAAPGAPR